MAQCCPVAGTCIRKWRRRAIAGTYLFDYERQQIPVTIELQGGKLIARSPIQPAAEELLPLSALKFVSADRGYGYEFHASGSEKATTAVVDFGAGRPLTGKRKP